MWDERSYVMPLIWHVDDHKNGSAEIIPIRKLEMKTSGYIAICVVICLGVISSLATLYMGGVTAKAVGLATFVMFVFCIPAFGIPLARMWQIEANKNEPDVIFSVDTREVPVLCVRDRMIFPSDATHVELEYVLDYRPGYYLSGRLERANETLYEEINLVVECDGTQERIGIVGAGADRPSKVKPVAQQLASIAGLPLSVRV